jgi:hypothetical protein
METFTVCLTGPSGPWKSALALEIEGALLERGVQVQVLEEKDRLAGRRLMERCRVGVAVLVSAPALEAPFSEEGSKGGLRLLEVRCEERAELPEGQGSQSPALHPTFLAKGGEADVRPCADKILELLESLGYFSGSAASAAAEYTPEEEKRIAERLADLGYLE